MMEKIVFFNDFDHFVKCIAPAIRWEVETSCMYRNREYKKGDFNNFCKATTQENCIGCKFYSPDLVERRRLVLEYVNSVNNSLVDSQLENIDLKDKNRSLNNEVDALTDEIKYLSDMVEFYRTCGTEASI